MGITRIADTIYAFRFLKLLVTAWEDTSAFKNGIIDENGKRIKKPVTAEEKESYTIFHRLVYNIKRLLNKLPLGQTKLASYAAALYLIKEESGLTEEQIEKVLNKLDLHLEKDDGLTESWHVRDSVLLPGDYILQEDFPNPLTGEMIHLKGTKVKVDEDCEPIDVLFNTPIYEVTHIHTNQKMYVAAGDLTR